MPTITIRRSDLAGLLKPSGRPSALTDETLHGLLPLVKGELKEAGGDGDELKIELNDSNRPDWWCAEGIARQLRLHRAPAAGQPLRLRRRGRLAQIRVERPVMAIRPFLGACIARNLPIDAALLEQIIQTQEKLAEIFGQKRRSLSIGYYRLDPLQFPLTYTAVKPTGAVFVPLGMEQPLTLEAILDEHPKGREYGHLLKGATRLPYFKDAAGQPLSFPPIVNSREVGEVRVGDRNLLIEVTGTDLRLVIMLVNLLAQNAADRGAMIEPVEVIYPNATPYGRRVVMPRDHSTPTVLKRDALFAVLGERLRDGEAVRALKQAGHRVAGAAGGWKVTPPPYRGDVMHPVDLIEDVAMMRGYGSLAPELPTSFTVGGVADRTRVEDHVRQWMIGLGFEEVLTNVLGARGDVLDKMGVEEPVVELENALSLQFAALRQWLLPSLLRVEAASAQAFYPHRIFEVGEVATVIEVPGGSPRAFTASGTRRSRTDLHLAALLASPAAAFSELHSALERFMLGAGATYRLTPASHPSFLDGRAGKISIGQQDAGWIGELHPAVLERWKITMPCVGWELALSRWPQAAAPGARLRDGRGPTSPS
ncbi:MAG: phenylalanine--tRNA ligase subunit beta [Nitrospirota bacterium]